MSHIEKTIARLWDGAVSVLDPVTLKVLARVQAHSAPASVAAQAGPALATGSLDGTLALWPAGMTGAPLALSGHDVAISALAFVKGGAGLVSAGHDGRILWHDATTGALQATLAEGLGQVWGLLAPSRGDLAIAAFGARGLAAWNLEGNPATGPLWSIDLGSRVRSMVAGPDGGPLALGLEDGRVLLLPDPAAATPPPDRLVTLGGHGLAIVDLAFLGEEGNRLASLSRDRTLRLWDVETGHLLGVWNNSGATPTRTLSTPASRRVAILYQADLAERLQLPAKTLRAAIAEVGLDLARAPPCRTRPVSSSVSTTCPGPTWSVRHSDPVWSRGPGSVPADRAKPNRSDRPAPAGQRKAVRIGAVYTSLKKIMFRHYCSTLSVHSVGAQATGG